MIIDPYNWSSVSITALDTVATDTICITFSRPSEYTFRAGQYAIARIKTERGISLMRQYSFASRPDATHLRFLIRKKPGGEVSGWFHTHAKIGDKIEITDPFGTFIRQDSQPALLIAGGVGVAPFISMVRQDTTALRLIYCESTSDKVCFGSVLADLLPDKALHVRTTSEAGRLQLETISSQLPDTGTVYVCGSKLFVDAITANLTTLGTAPERIKRELFTLQ